MHTSTCIMQSNYVFKCSEYHSWLLLITFIQWMYLLKRHNNMNDDIDVSIRMFDHMNVSIISWWWHRIIYWHLLEACMQILELNDVNVSGGRWKWRPIVCFHLFVWWWNEFIYWYSMLKWMIVVDDISTDISDHSDLFFAFLYIHL